MFHQQIELIEAVVGGKWFNLKIFQEVIAEDEGEEDEDFGFTELDNGLVIYKKLVERLYPHQV